MAITFYSSVVCPWAARSWLALKEAGIEFELVEIDLQKPREPWYLEINPLGKVPALKLEDGTILCESSVISEYIADKYGKLLPTDAVKRAQIRFFIENFTAKFTGSLFSVFSTTPDKQRDVFRGFLSAINALLKQYLHGGPFLLGSAEYTLAEVDCVPFLARFHMLGEAGLFPQQLYEESKNDSEFALLFQYIGDCLKRKSHLEIWDQERNLQMAKKRLSMMKQTNQSDYIFLEDLKVTGMVGLSAFAFEDRKFPLTISMDVKTKPVEPGEDDYAISYGDVAREVVAVVEQQQFQSLESAAAALLQTKSTTEGWQKLNVTKDGGLLRAEKEIFEAIADGKAIYTIKRVRVGCIIGVYEHERVKKQDVVLDISLIGTGWSPSQRTDQIVIETETRKALEDIVTAIEQSSYKTVEALAEKICEIGLATIPGSYQQIRAWISKPSALVFADHSGVCITRNRPSSSNL